MTASTASRPRSASAWRALLEDNGWDLMGSNTFRRLVTGLPTPEYVPGRHWPWETYDSAEFLTFYGEGGKITGRVLYRQQLAPWIPPEDRWVTQAAAVEIIKSRPLL